MSRIHGIDLPGYPRHLGMRAVDGMACFRSDKDRHVFLGYLREAIARGGCPLNAFVLMTNHIHLLATPTETGAVPAMMHSVGTRYARYFNAVYERTGPLFEGRYWSSHLHNIGMETRPELTFHGEYLGLGPTNAACARAWSNFVEQGIASDQLTRLRKQFRRNKPLGSNAFVDRFGKMNPVREPGS